MKVLVIGGAGFIGSNIADYYLKKNMPVTIMDNFSRHGTLSNLEWLKNNYEKRLKVVRGDIRTDIDKLKKLAGNHDVIFHMAAQVAVTTSVTSPRNDFEINALGTFNILEAIRCSKNNPILIYASTNKVYGGLEDVELVEKNDRYEFKSLKKGVSENRQLDFHSPYGCSKGAADQYVRDYARIYKLKTIVFRQSCIYGWRQFGIEDQGWVAHFIISSILNKPLTIYGNGKQVRDLLFIDDLLNAFNLAIANIKNTAGEIYNIGGGQNNQISIIQCIGLIEKILKKKIPISFDKWRTGDQPIYISNLAKAKIDFNWQPKIGIDEGLKLLIEWVINNKTLFRGA